MGRHYSDFGPKGAKMAQNSQKVEKIRFLDSARNALKWHSNGLNGPKIHFYGLLTPFWPLLASSPPAFGGSRGPNKAPKGLF